MAAYPNLVSYVITDVSPDTAIASVQRDFLLTVRVDLNGSGFNDSEVAGFFEYEGEFDEDIISPTDPRIDYENAPNSRVVRLTYAFYSTSINTVRNIANSISKEFTLYYECYADEVTEEREEAKEFNLANRSRFELDGETYAVNPLETSALIIARDESFTLDFPTSPLRVDSYAKIKALKAIIKAEEKKLIEGDAKRRADYLADYKARIAEGVARVIESEEERIRALLNENNALSRARRR